MVCEAHIKNFYFRKQKKLQCFHNVIFFYVKKGFKNQKKKKKIVGMKIKQHKSTYKQGNLKNLVLLSTYFNTAISYINLCNIIWIFIANTIRYTVS